MSQLPDNVVADTLAFSSEVEKFLAGETSSAAFRGICAAMGIYEQRETGTYMLRVRGAAGLFLPHQAKTVADLSKTFGNGIVHVTTRQDLQIHGVRIEDIPAILERLLDVDLSSRGGGGNTVRNVAACSRAGICVDEVFDVTPYALALSEYLIRERGSFNLPRKFKVSFSGCGKDCGLCSVADLGFFAHEVEGVRGFAVYAGGGMGAHSSLGILIEEFIPAESIFEVSEAVKRLFDKHGDRANRSKARLRFVVERVGADEFRRLYREELESVRQEQISVPAVLYQEKKANMHAVRVSLPLGDIPAHHLLALADIASSKGDGTLRATQEQTLQLRVAGSQFKNAVIALRKLDERFACLKSLRCVACVGASTCKLGQCDSRGLAAAIEAELRDAAIPFEATIRISGCRNSCGQHPIAPLGFYGSAERIDGELVHFYTVVAGGRLAEGDSVLAQPIVKVYEKAVPTLLKEFCAAAAANRRSEEPFADLMSRWGTGYIRQLAKKYESVPSHDGALG